MRGDSRGAVLTTHTHTLSRSLKILSQIRSHTVCPRSGLGCVVPGTAKENVPISALCLVLLYWTGILVPGDTKGVGLLRRPPNYGDVG
ncbi:hypothetical protein J6590_062044 [Homalodisca vitripennis]|nr:hypothetical protein J6590_062044 [Homalodisca vitripennis]